MAVAVPAAGLGLADLIAVCGVLLLIGLLYSAHGLVRTLFFPFEISVPYVGKVFGGVTGKIEGALLSWIDAGIAAQQRTLVDLFSGLVWIWDETAKAMKETAIGAENAFEYLHDTAIPDIFHAINGDTAKAAHGAAASVTALSKDLASEVHTLEGKITHAVDTAENYADAAIHKANTHVFDTIASTATALKGDLGSAIHGVETTLAHRIDAIGGGIESKIEAARNAAIAAIQPKIDSALREVGKVTGITDTELHDAISRAFTDSLAAGGTVTGAIHSAISAAGAFTNPVTGSITDEVNALIAGAISSALSAGGLIESDIEATVHAAIADIATTGDTALDRLNDLLHPVEQKIRDLTNVTLPELAAIVAGTAATLALVEAESGLNNPSCRAKHKEICGIDPSAWTGLLGGLALVGFGLSFEDLVDTAREMINPLLDVGSDIGILGG